MSLGNGMTQCGCGNYLDSCPDCNDSSNFSYVPTQSQLKEIKERRKLQKELETKQKEEFEKVYKPFLALLKDMYPDAEEEELRKFFRRIPSIKVSKDNLILERVTVFLSVHKENIKEKLDLTETCYLVSFFFRGIRFTSPWDMKIPGHMDYDCRWVSNQNFKNIFNFLLEVNKPTFKGKHLFSSNNWRRQSMDYLNPLITMLDVLNSCRGYDYRKIFFPCLKQASEVFAETEGDERKGSLWKAVLTSGDYGKRYVLTRNPLNFSFNFFRPIYKEVFKREVF